MYDTYIMKRTQIYLEDEQSEKLARRASAAGVTKSTLIRDAIDAYLDASTADRAGLERFRAALEQLDPVRSALPEGRVYVEALRAADTERQRELERRRR